MYIYIYIIIYIYIYSNDNTSNNSPEETPNQRRDSKNTGRYHVHECV